MNFPNSKGRSILKTSYFSIIGQDGINTVVIICVQEVEVKSCLRATAVVVPKGLFEKLRCHSDLGTPVFLGIVPPRGRYLINVYTGRLRPEVQPLTL